MIEVCNLSKNYGNKLAVDNISFTANDGEILGFLGPNGAGKSTTMNMLTGYLSSSGGCAKINGIDVLEDPIGAKKNIGYLPEQPPLYLDMTVNEYLNFVYGIKRCKMPKKSHLGEIKSLTKIDDVQNRVIRNLSKGYRQRVGLAQALVGNPATLILDEPTVGLDPKQIIEIRTLIKKLGKSHTVILSSHILPEIQAVCDRIIIINKGVIAADGTADEIAKNITNEHKMTVRIEGSTKTAADKDEIVSAVKAISGVKYIRADMERENGVFDYDIEAETGCDIRRDLNKLCCEKGWNMLMMQLSDLTLEDIFLKITVGDGLIIKNDNENAEDAENAEVSEKETDKPEKAEKASKDSGKNKKNGGKN